MCNLGSVNLAQHLLDGQIDQRQAEEDGATAMRMLDNVIDINYYAVKKARDSNLRHRPVGLGRDGLPGLPVPAAHPYASAEAVEFADRSMEAVCYHAYWASTDWPRSAAATPATAAPVGPRHPAAGLAWTCWPRRVAATWTSTASTTMDWDALRARIRNTACATATAWPSPPRPPSATSSASTPRSSPLRQPVGQVQPVGRVHGHQRVPGARPQKRWACGTT